MTLLSLGVIGTSAKENEHRLPLHPDHIENLDPDIRAVLTLEDGYAERFGRSDADLAPLVAGFASRKEILASSDVVLLPKPQHSDVAALAPGQVLWGWPHCVQDTELTQLAIDQGLTLIAFEAMNHWTRDGNVGLHVFHKNNELAGFCSVLQAMELAGISGIYGRRLSAVVIGFGATARGAVTALNAHGVHDIAVLTNRGVAAVGSPIHSVLIRQFEHDPDTPGVSHVITDRGRVPLAPYLAENDIIVNCTLQDTSAPLMYLQTEDLRRVPSRQRDRGRLLRPRHGVQLGPSDVVRGPDVRGREPRPLLRRRPQPVVPLELRDLGDQLGADPVPAAGAGGSLRLGGQRDPQSRDRDLGRTRHEPGDPGLPGARRGAPAPRGLIERRVQTGQASASSLRVSASSSGRVLVRPMIGRKFWSPAQRGTMCWCRCAEIPAPAIAPWFMPMLKP